MSRPIDPQSLIVPSVIEQTPRGERVFDIYSRLLKDRIIFIGTPIDDVMANLVIVNQRQGYTTAWLYLNFMLVKTEYHARRIARVLAAHMYFQLVVLADRIATAR